MPPINYLILGAGGTGACIAGYLTDAGKNVTLIARNQTLEAIRRDGLLICLGKESRRISVRAVSEEEYQGTADIIFVCVKGYSLEEMYPLIRRASGPKTVVIPILNIYGTGERMAKEFPGIQVLNGCIYISAAARKPGVIQMSGKIFRIVYGSVDGRKDNPLLFQLEEDLRDAGITPVYSDQIRRDTLQKFAMVSPMAAVGSYYDVPCGAMKKPGEIRDRYAACIAEIDSLARAMGMKFPVDVVQENLKILDGLSDDYTASMQKDLKRGGPSEIDGLVYEVVRMGHRLGVPVPNYEEIAEALFIRLKKE